MGCIIGIDIDSVLSDTSNAVLNYMNQEYLYDLKLSDIEVYRIQDNQAVEPAHAENALKWFWEVGLNDVSLIDGAKKTINKYYAYNKIVLITSRPTFTKNNTIKWLKNNAIKYDELVYVDAAEKWQYAVFNKIDIIVEDRYDTVIKCALEGIISIMLKYPWNSNKKDDDEFVVLCNTWHDIDMWLGNILGVVKNGPITNTRKIKYRYKRGGVYFGDQRGLNICGNDMVLKKIIEKHFLELRGEYNVYDLCCGNGVTLCAWATEGFNVLGVEKNKKRVKNAKLNILIKGLGVSSYVLRGDVRNVSKWFKETNKSIVHIDPDWGAHYHVNDAENLEQTFPNIIELLGLISAYIFVIRLPIDIKLNLDDFNKEYSIITYKCEAYYGNEMFIYLIMFSEKSTIGNVITYKDNDISITPFGRYRGQLNL